MTAFVPRDATHLGADRIATSTTAFALYDNLFAFAEGAVGAPRIQTGAIQNGAVTGTKIAQDAITEGNIAPSSVGQTRIRSTTGDVSVGGGGIANLMLAGGEYGFYPQVAFLGGPVASIGATIAVNYGSGYAAIIHLDASASGVNTAGARQRYIQASPPYDLGDGSVPLFVFAAIDSAGNVRMTYSAEDPPWANNGPTSIRADFYDEQGRGWQRRRRRPNMDALRNPAQRETELARISEPEEIEVTQALKQADMPLIPHPFQGNDLTGLTVVLLDPIGQMAEQLRALHQSGENISGLLHGEYLRLGNAPIARTAPPGVMPVSVTWR
jgi:hypothetical protein